MGHSGAGQSSFVLPALLLGLDPRSGLLGENTMLWELLTDASVSRELELPGLASCASMKAMKDETCELEKPGTE